ncbi:MAG: hypothetical protein COV46_08525 [Deltaproteobacteria bacterium CG11_big_fil_rev_8_21_14_0_20_49_13]|nr:MAG: hypothetical protein COV46_08525 [Deltaproteobacteria bacterium CG11_big_fil_rev_8_21_14_0_20_49_13]
MKKLLSLILIASLTVVLSSSCKKPQKQKTSVQQTIETPVMQMAEPAQVTKAMPGVDQPTEPIPEGKQIPTSPASPTIVKSATNVELIIDASGSMSSPISQTIKIDAVRAALKEIFTAPVPAEVGTRKIAIRTYGGGSPSDKENCADTFLEFPMGKYDSTAFNAALSRITPQGVSPIAFVLEEANKDFTESAETTDNLLILIADGLDSCNGNIMAAVERLHNGPGRVIVDIIGFDVDQATSDAFKKIAEAGSGTFYLARSDAELASALDQAISANLPYNLRVKVLSGASPVHSLITIFRANTQSVVDRSESPGFKFFRLAPGTYDIQVEYTDSIEASKPAKIIKGVDVTSTSKTEQIVQFDLGNLNLIALDQDGKDTKTNIYIRRAGTEDIVGQLNAVTSPQMVHLTPGLYDIDAETAVEGTAALTTQAKGVEVKTGETTELTLKFQTGKLSLKAQNVLKEPIPFTYKITQPELTESLLDGESISEGTVIDLPPGNYDVYVMWSDPVLHGSAEAKLSNIQINGGETLEQLVTVITGSVKLSGKDSSGKYVYTEFAINKEKTQDTLITVVADTEPVMVMLAPGVYDITATNTTSKIVPAPSVAWESTTVKEGEIKTLDAVFKLGSIKLIGKNAKQQTIPTTFTVYRGGTDDALVSEESEREWTTFTLTPGLYDIRAEETLAKTDQKPNVWFYDVEIKEGTSITSEAVFTSGKLKLLCRGKNNVVLTCEFNVFSYGSDIALFSGTTTDDWKEFDIPPGKYYMEAGWNDPVEEQFLKKWINLSIDENQIVEQILRF